MKTLLKILGVLLLVIIIAMLLLPFIFRDEIIGTVKNATNQNLNAQVDFTDISLSLFKDFPNVAVGIENLSIINKEPFEGDTVISAESIDISVDLFSIINGEVLKVKSISLDSPKIMVYVLKDGSANYNIAKSESSESAEREQTDTTVAQYNIELESYSITNGRIAYIDQTSNMIVALDNLNHSGSGDFSQDNFILDTETSIDALTLQMEGIKYLNSVKTNLDMQLGINLPSMSFTLKDNSLSLNNLLLNFEGSVAIPDEDVDIDLVFSSPRSDFKDIISLIPAIYKNDFSQLETSGKMNFNGNIKGKLTESTLPTFNIALNVENGNFQYPDLPIPVQNVSVELKVRNSDGKIDNTIIDLNNIHLKLGTDPLEGRLRLTNIESGPNVDTKIKGKINLTNIKNAFGLEDIQKLEGIIESDFEAKGNISTASTNYENIDAKGKIILKDLIYLEKGGKDEVKVRNAELNFTPKNIRLNSLAVNIDKSDLKANGTLNNLISYVLSDGTLYGQLNVESSFFDLNPFMQSENVEEQKSVEGEETSAFDIPKGINFTLTSSFGKLIYDNLELENVRGKVTVREGKISLSDLNMNLLDGSLSGNGYYAKTEYQENPDIQFNLSVSNMNIKKTYDKFISVKQFAPIAQYMQGSFSSNLKMNSKLDQTMTPIWNTFFSNGVLNLKSAEIKNFKPFTTVGSLLNLQELSNPKLTNVNPKYEIKNGRFYLSPVSYKIDKYNVTLSGSNGIDQSLDYVMDIEVPAEKIKNQANSAIAGLIGKDLNLVKSNTINVKALIGGSISSPNVKTSAADVATDITTQVKDAVVEEAKAQADSLKAAAEQKLKEEAKKKEEEMKKKLEEEAKKKLKKLFGFG